MHYFQYSRFKGEFMASILLFTNVLRGRRNTCYNSTLTISKFSLIIYGISDLIIPGNVKVILCLVDTLPNF